jgi:hypothetical protein
MKIGAKNIQILGKFDTFFTCLNSDLNHSELSRFNKDGSSRGVSEAQHGDEDFQ